jgi:hypothetical protein
MTIKADSFLTNMMIAAAYAKIEPTSKSPLAEIEKKIVILMDTILSKLSADYRKASSRVTNQIKNIKEGKSKQAGRVAEAKEKILPKETKKTQKIPDVVDFLKKQEQLDKIRDPLEKMINDLAETFESKEVADTSEKERVAQELRNLKKLKEYLKTNPRSLEVLTLMFQEVASLKFAEDFKELFGEMDPALLAEDNPNIEKIAAQFNIEKEKEEIKKLLAEGGPGALAGLLFYLQGHVAKGGKLEDIWEKLT